MWNRRTLGSPKRLPTDRDILQAIYDRHHESLTNFNRGQADRQTAIMVPIDCEELARQFHVHPDIVFGRLHYHLEQKYGYATPDGPDRSRVAFFAVAIKTDRHCVNLPLLASVLAGLQEEGARNTRTLVVSVVSLVIAMAALLVSW